MQLLRCLTRWNSFIELNIEKEESWTVSRACKWLTANLVMAEKFIIATCGMDCIQGQAVKNGVQSP